MTTEQSPVDLQSAFREVMSKVCTPVAVVTALAGERPHGTTVSAFASLSMTPPMVLVSLNRRSDLLAIVCDTGRFGLNVLAGEQSALAVAFARKGADRFAEVDWEIDTDVPRISGAGGFVACAVAQLTKGGDHVIALGNVRSASVLPARPLTYHDRAFGTYAPLATLT